MNFLDFPWINDVQGIGLKNIHERGKRLSLIVGNRHRPRNFLQLPNGATLLFEVDLTVDCQIKDPFEHLLGHVLDHKGVLLAAHLRQHIEDQARHCLQNYELAD